MKKILLVDDDSAMLDLYKTILEEEFTVLTASNGHEALSLAKSDKPDLALLDVMMPEMNGIQVLEQLKADPETAGIPAVMLTNLTDAETKKSAMDKGAEKYLIKSDYDPDELLKQIADVIA